MKIGKSLTECVSGGADGQGYLIEMRARWQAARVERARAPSAARDVRRWMNARLAA